MSILAEDADVEGLVGAIDADKEVVIHDNMVLMRHAGLIVRRLYRNVL